MASTAATARTTRAAKGLETIAAPRRRPPISKIVGRILFWLLILFILFYTLFPFYWAIVSSLTFDSQLFNTPASYWPSQIDWSHYAYVLRNDDFLKALRNSVVVSVGTVAIALLLGSLAAFALGRIQFRGRTAILYIILSMTMFPGVAILGSLFLMIRGEWFLHTPNLYNTRIALIVTYLIFTLPFTIWVMTQFFKAMPGELEEAALVDGAGYMRVFWQILLPLAAPGLVTTGLLAFIAAWNEFLFALTFTNNYDARTVQVAISQFSGRTQYELPYANRMAASVLVTLPLIALVLIFQRKILAGLTAGAVKG
ncbi:MAG: carbohydrate ABC transporter permease [Thermomicrobiales bacterium]|nr:carbohydrate ABC transporter permease [Thermomicrobiales bacterium]